MLTGQKKINLILDNVGVKAPTFAKKIGVKYQRILDIQTGKVKNISAEVASRIVDAYPQFSIAWLLSGEGEMLKDDDRSEIAQEISSGKVIPYYDAEVAAGTEYGMEMTPTSPVGWIEIGGILKDSEFAMRVYGNSMVPNYPAGCVIGLRRYTEHFIEPGTVYVVETTENRFLKRLYYNKEKTSFRCMSDNHMKHESGPMEGEFFYPEFEIPFEDVRRLFRVTGVVKRNIL